MKTAAPLKGGHSAQDLTALPSACASKALLSMNTKLVGVLVIIAAVILAVTGAYPRPLYDLVLGMNRWALRVAGYAALMTDVYPPFRLDQGGSDPILVVPPVAGPPGPADTTTPTV